MTNATIAIADLQVLLEVVEGYTSENGIDAAGRYATPRELQQAIINAKTAIRKSET